MSQSISNKVEQAVFLDRVVHNPAWPKITPALHHITNEVLMYDMLKGGEEITFQGHMGVSITIKRNQHVIL